MIKINKIDKYFNKGKNNEIHVVDNASLEFKNNGLVCILGQSGSGKTTLLNTIGGLDDFENGTIEAFNETINRKNKNKYEKIRNKNYGYIFQNYYLLEDQSVVSNIEICLSMYDFPEKEKMERINQVLNIVGMIKYKKKIVNQLSGGQRQRVAIARALAKSPNVIFADEPTGNLDEKNTLKVMSILKQISKQCLVIIVTHERNIANFFADRIIEVSDGKITSDKIQSHDDISYEYIDNNNIYLKEYNKSTINNNNNILCNFYSNDSTTQNLDINIVYKDNKYYIDCNSNCEIVYLNNTNDTKMLNENIPKLNLSDIEENINFNLKKI